MSTALAAFGTLTLAIIGAVSIDQTRSQERYRRKQEIVSNIVEWAVTLVEFPDDETLSKILHASDVREQELDKYNHIINTRERLQSLLLRAQYYEGTLPQSDSQLKDSIREVTKVLNVYVEFLEDWQHRRAEEIPKELPDPPERTELAAEHESALKAATDKVIAAAASITAESIY